VRLKIPQEKSALVAIIHRTGRVSSQHYENNDILLEADIPPSLRGRLEDFIVASETGC
jgi:hypothetical protein